MRIICPTCARHYEVDAEKIGPSGQLVRCAECREVWLVRRSDGSARPSPDALRPHPARPDRDPNAFAAAAVAAAADGRPSEPPIDFAKARARLHDRRAAEGQPRVRAGAAGTVLSVAAAVAAMAGVTIGFRAAIVDQVPATAPAFAAVGLPAQPAGLALQDVRSVVSTEGSRTVLDLEGRIANLQDRPAAVPDLSVVAHDASVQLEDPGTQAAARGRRVGRLPHPPRSAAERGQGRARLLRRAHADDPVGAGDPAARGRPGW